MAEKKSSFKSAAEIVTTTSAVLISGKTIMSSIDDGLHKVQELKNISQQILESTTIEEGTPQAEPETAVEPVQEEAPVQPTQHHAETRIAEPIMAKQVEPMMAEEVPASEIFQEEEVVNVEEFTITEDNTPVADVAESLQEGEFEVIGIESEDETLEVSQSEDNTTESLCNDNEVLTTETEALENEIL